MCEQMSDSFSKYFHNSSHFYNISKIVIPRDGVIRWEFGLIFKIFWEWDPYFDSPGLINRSMCSPSTIICWSMLAVHLMNGSF